MLTITKTVPAEWYSFDEHLGDGDGERTRFLVPFSPAEARELVILREFAPLDPEKRLREESEFGNMLRDEEDGYKLVRQAEEGTGEEGTSEPLEALYVEFDRPPASGSRLSCCALGRRPGGGAVAFKIAALTTLLQERLNAKLPESMKRRKGEPSMQDVHATCRAAFLELVVDWEGVVDDAKAPLPCTPENKRLFVDSLDVKLFGLLVQRWAQGVARARIQAREADLGK